MENSLLTSTDGVSGRAGTQLKGPAPPAPLRASLIAPWLCPCLEGPLDRGPSIVGMGGSLDLTPGGG